MSVQITNVVRTNHPVFAADYFYMYRSKIELGLLDNKLNASRQKSQECVAMEFLFASANGLLLFLQSKSLYLLRFLHGQLSLGHLTKISEILNLCSSHPISYFLLPENFRHSILHNPTEENEMLGAHIFFPSKVASKTLPCVPTSDLELSYGFLGLCHRYSNKGHSCIEKLHPKK